MTTPTADLLTLQQWLSPAFPIGGFAYSHGLETAVTDGAVCDAATAEAWIAEVLVHGAGPLDAGLLLAAFRGEDLKALQARAAALAVSSERWEETSAQGIAFAAAVTATGVAVPPLALPIAVGAAARGLEIDDVLVASAYLQAFAANLVGAVVRFVPLGQVEGQKLITALRPLAVEVAERASETPLEALGSGAFGADLAALRHEDLEVRIFKT